MMSLTHWLCPQGHIRDITDSLIERCQEKSGGEDACLPISNEKIMGIVSDLFGAGGNISEGKFSVGRLGGGAGAVEVRPWPCLSV